MKKIKKNIKNMNNWMWDKRPISRKMIYEKVINENSVGVEVGVWQGNNAKLIYSYNPKELYLVDIWEPQPDNEMYSVEKGSYPKTKFDEAFKMVGDFFSDKKNVKIIKKYSKDAAKDFDDESLDFIYIDAGHYYEAVKIDLETWYPKIKKGGYIIGDDYIISPEFKFGVIEAVDEFIENHEVEIIYFDSNETFPLPGCGQYCLLKN